MRSRVSQKTVNMFRPSPPPFEKDLSRGKDKAGYDVSVLPEIVMRRVVYIILIIWKLRVNIPIETIWIGTVREVLTTGMNRKRTMRITKWRMYYRIADAKENSVSPSSNG